MSRSYKKNYYTGWTTCRSEKYDKQLWHRRYRLSLRLDVLNYLNRPFTDYIPLHFRQKSNVWNMGKDGKQLITYDSIMYASHWALRVLSISDRPLKHKDPLREFFKYIGK